MPPISPETIRFHCPLCGWETAKGSAVPQHLRWHHPGLKHCPQCYVLLPAAEIVAHVAAHKLDLVACPECGQMFAKRALGGHTTMTHRGGILTPEMHHRAMQKRSQNAAYCQGVSERMKTNNPMSKPAALAKMTTTIKGYIDSGRIKPFGGRPYGNGNDPTPAEQAALTLYPQAQTQWVVTLGDGERPEHYKIDLAWPEQLIGLELDGTSHNLRARKTADQRKIARLGRLGWTILHAPNQDALSGKIASLLSPFGIMPG